MNIGVTSDSFGGQIIMYNAAPSKYDDTGPVQAQYCLNYRPVSVSVMG